VHEPGRPPGIEAPGIFTGLHPRAILIGVVVDSLATLVAGFALVSVFAARQGPGPDGGVSDEALDSLTASPEFLLASLVVGLACTSLGGFVGARRAGTSFARHGGWIGVGSALVALLLSVASGPDPSPPPLWFELAGYLLVIPAGVLGGLLAGLRARRLPAQGD
jgi:putative membrane protein (TIGR04086 family)